MENSTSTTRTRTQSALKWMANERASVLGELELVLKALTALRERESRLQGELHALDVSMRRFDPELDPTVIRPVVAWKERNGGQGTPGRRHFQKPGGLTFGKHQTCETALPLVTGRGPVLWAPSLGGCI